jgi:hypothetical protein
MISDSRLQIKEYASGSEFAICNLYFREHALLLNLSRLTPGPYLLPDLVAQLQRRANGVL